jgi:cytochrome c-type biogenesis protein CcmE
MARATTIEGFERYRKSATRTNLKFIIMGVIILAAAAFIVFSAMQGATVYYLEVNEVQAKLATNTLGTEPVRMGGQVIPGTIKSGMVSGSYVFEVSDMKEKAKTLTVTFRGVVPDTFKDEAQVTVTGKYDPNTKMFVATELLAKCPSKYSTTNQSS